MTILSGNDQKGRSMVEMLGVLAIIGVLSVGGISGYSKAMAKFKLTKAQDQMSMLLMNVRTAFATSPSYAGLNNASAVAFGIVPSDMSTAKASAMTPTSTGVSGSLDQLNNAFGGAAHIFACDTPATDYECRSSTARENESDQYFGIVMAGLGREVCTSLASSDWGADGLVAVEVQETPGTPGKIYPVDKLPIRMTEAAAACSNNASIIWTYY